MTTTNTSRSRKGLSELELQERGLKTELQHIDRTTAAEVRRAAKVRAALPEVPPGVQTFDPRRLRRHARKAAMFSANRNLAKMLGESEARRKRLAAQVADQRMKEARDAAAQRRTFTARAKSFVGRLLGRRSG